MTLFFNKVCTLQHLILNKAVQICCSIIIIVQRLQCFCLRGVRVHYKGLSQFTSSVKVLSLCRLTKLAIYKHGDLVSKDTVCCVDGKVKH